MGQRSTCHDRRELSANERVVIADAPGTPGQMDAELQMCEHCVASDGNRRARCGWLIALSDALQCSRLRVRNQSLTVHRHRVHGTQEAQTLSVGGTCRDRREAESVEGTLYRR